MEDTQARLSTIAREFEDNTNLTAIGRKRLKKDGLDLPELESSIEKLEVIKTEMVDLADAMSKLTPELFNHDKKKFVLLAERANKDMLVVETLLVDFEAKVQADYNPPTFWIQAWLLVLAPFSQRANHLRSGIKKIKNQRKAFLKARREFQNIIDSHKIIIYEIENAELIQMQRMLLAQDKDYQKIKEALIQERNSSYCDYHHTNRMEEEIEAMKERMLVIARDRLENGWRTDVKY